MKRGSALLVVLGMLAFMVISAVAFSAFMRNSRLPSSFLLRTSSTRHLAKAAVAEAIDIIDASIADNPHPGLGNLWIEYPRAAGGEKQEPNLNRNVWVDHVYIGTNTLNGVVDAEQTVSTLTLEGLAYLPPALVNEARYWSRHSPAAAWHSFSFDAGRFAFCAVDVSDHIDVNKVAAGVVRGSSPANRLSIGYAFENVKHDDWYKQPGEWDKFMENVFGPVAAIDPGNWTPYGTPSTSKDKLRATSLADLNLAVNNKGGNFRDVFPLMKFLGGSANEIVDVAENDPSAEAMRNLRIVAAGGAFGTTNAVYDLTDKEYQPFSDTDMKSGANKTFEYVMEEVSTKAYNKLLEYVPRLALAGLWDYLDKDNVPVSLAMPSTERAPMVCGIIPKLGSSGAVKIATKMEDPDGNSINDGNLLKVAYKGADKTTPPAAGDKRTVRYVKKYLLDKSAFSPLLDGGSITPIVAYPFRRGIDLKAADTFKIDGHVSFFFAAEGMTLRTGSPNSAVRIEGDPGMENKSYNDAQGVLHAPLSAQNLSFTGVKDEKSALKKLSAFIIEEGASEALKAVDEKPVLSVVYKMTQTAVDNGSGTVVWQNDATAPERESAQSQLPMLNAKGIRDSAFDDSNSLIALARDGGKKFALNMAIWLRITNGDGKTVDLVPACLKDDKAFNNVANDGLEGPYEDATGAAYPLMRYTLCEAFEFKEDVLEQMVATPVAAALPANPELMCADPRWNWAPEHWFRHEISSVDDWLAACHRDDEGRDGDIFMAASDSGYLQSVYELAFIPRLIDREDETDGALYKLPGTSFAGGFEEFKGASATISEFYKKFDDCRNSKFMWKTYRTFDLGNKYWRDNFENLGFTSDGGGQKLNPYSQTQEALYAAFANTPESWWAAGGDQELGMDASDRLDAAANNKKYAFCEGSTSGARLPWEDVRKIASTFMLAVSNEVVREAKANDGTQYTVWEDAYDELWAKDFYANLTPDERSKRLWGQELSATADRLYGVDRKFLYGYWKDCFALKQQLFLVFVRAEPMMMGGGAIGQTPPQLGSRAVALVWRNPVAPAPASDPPPPHRTRVIFYRQFD